MKKLWFILVLLSLISCKEIISEALKSANNTSIENLSDSEYKEITVDPIYKLSVPNYMKEMKSLNDEASLQYANIYKETYTVVIHENKQDFVNYFKELNEYDDEISVIENYSQAQTKFFEANVDINKMDAYGLTKINGYNARQIKMKGTVEGQNIGYIVGYFEGKEHLYLVMNWTLLDRLDKYENTFESINNSFKLIEN